MIRLTVLYNLPKDTVEEDFLAWRLSEHQVTNESMPGAIRTDFARIIECWPDGSLPPYRFQTTVDWFDRQSFDAGFHDETVQAKLHENLKKLGAYSFTISEILIERSCR